MEEYCKSFVLKIHIVCEIEVLLTISRRMQENSSSRCFFSLLFFNYYPTYFDTSARKAVDLDECDFMTLWHRTSAKSLLFRTVCRKRICLATLSLSMNRKYHNSSNSYCIVAKLTACISIVYTNDTRKPSLLFSVCSESFTYSIPRPIRWLALLSLSRELRWINGWERVDPKSRRAALLD